MRPADSPGSEHGATYDGAAMCDMVEFVARNLVDNQDAVEVTHIDRGQAVEVRLKVDPDEMGKIIGRQGRVVKALRTVLVAAATRSGKRVLLEVG